MLIHCCFCFDRGFSKIIKGSSDFCPNFQYCKRFLNEEKLRKHCPRIEWWHQAYFNYFKNVVSFSCFLHYFFFKYWPRIFIKTVLNPTKCSSPHCLWKFFYYSSSFWMLGATGSSCSTSVDVAVIYFNFIVNFFLSSCFCKTPKWRWFNKFGGDWIKCLTNSMFGS